MERILHCNESPEGSLEPPDITPEIRWVISGPSFDAQVCALYRKSSFEDYNDRLNTALLLVTAVIWDGTTRQTTQVRPRSAEKAYSSTSSGNVSEGTVSLTTPLLLSLFPGAEVSPR